MKVRMEETLGADDRKKLCASWKTHTKTRNGLLSYWKYAGGYTDDDIQGDCWIAVKDTGSAILYWNSQTTKYWWKLRGRKFI